MAVLTDRFYMFDLNLDLSDNQLDGPIPSSSSYYTNTYFIGKLWLQNNRLCGDVTLLLSQVRRPQSIRVQGNSFTGDLTKVLDTWTLGDEYISYLTVWDLSHNNFSMIPSEKFLNPLQSTLEALCNKTFVYGTPTEFLKELRLAGSDLMGQPLPERLNCPSSMSLDSLQILDLAPCNLRGVMPDELFNINMPSLTFLNLSNNRLSGPIPKRLPINLRQLDLGRNSVDGQIPAQSFTALLNMTFLNVSHNRLYGAIPEKLPLTLNVLDLANNNLEGIMLPELFAGLPNLLHFNASNNKLSGSIPPTFPVTLQVLDLSHNNLTGQIPGNLFLALPNLEYIDLSGNNLSGRIPDGLPPVLNKKSVFADNPGLCGSPLEQCMPPPLQDPAQGGGGIKLWMLVTVVVSSVLVCTGSCLLLVWRWKVYSRKHQQDADLIATLLQRETVTVMPLRELRKATSKFSESAQIGVGGFGTVYAGKLADGTAVAIKKSKKEGSPEYKQQFLNEVKILSGVNHRHLVKLLGCFALLVFKFVPNGTLKEHLQGTGEGSFSQLSWRQRLLIALQTSDALAYLHSAAAPPIFHRDIKSSNILLDDALHAKVADFGLSKLAPNKAATHVSTVAIQGTMGYIDPEYYSSFQLTPRSDVYSFGVVLLELITAKPVVDFGRGNDETGLVNLALSAMDRGEWEGLIDPVLADTYGLPSGKASIDSVSTLAVRCLAFRSRERPEMREVWKELQTIWLLLEDSFPSDHIRHDVQLQNASFFLSFLCF